MQVAALAGVYGLEARACGRAGQTFFRTPDTKALDAEGEAQAWSLPSLGMIVENKQIPLSPLIVELSESSLHGSEVGILTHIGCIYLSSSDWGQIGECVTVWYTSCLPDICIHHALAVRFLGDQPTSTAIHGRCLTVN